MQLRLVRRVPVARKKHLILLSAFLVASSLTAFVASSGGATGVSGKTAALTSVDGYWLANTGGAVKPYGRAGSFGSVGAGQLAAPVVGMAPTVGGGGYWLVTSNGTVLTFGNAKSYGSLVGADFVEPIVTMAATVNGGGYWLVAADGRVFPFGDARLYGPRNVDFGSRVTAMAPTPEGGGYWIAVRNGGVFAFGDASYHGSAVSTGLHSDVVGIAAAPDGNGYWLVTASGEVVPLGSAGHFGSLPARPSSPIVGMAVTPDGGGYWLAARDGTVYSLGDATDFALQLKVQAASKKAKAAQPASHIEIGLAGALRVLDGALTKQSTKESTKLRSVHQYVIAIEVPRNMVSHRIHRSTTTTTRAPSTNAVPGTTSPVPTTGTVAGGTDLAATGGTPSGSTTTRPTTTSTTATTSTTTPATTTSTRATTTTAAPTTTTAAATTTTAAATTTSLATTSTTADPTTTSTTADPTTTSTTHPTTTTAAPTTTTAAPTTTTVAPTTTTTVAPTTTTTVAPTTTTTAVVQSGGPGGAPTTPPAEICGSSTLTSPYTSAPSGAVTVPAGNNSSQMQYPDSDTTYWFASGTHTIGNALNSAMNVSNGDVFIGAPGAIIDGQGLDGQAFVNASAGASNVTIEYLTIENFENVQQAVVNENLESDWTVEYDTIKNNPSGVGIGLGTGGVAEYDCLTGNGELGIVSYNKSDLTITHNEVAYNDPSLFDYPGVTQCGCAGGIKILTTTDATINDNYIHNNGDVGIWADTNNAGIDISGNWISSSYNEGIQYEISYNGNITDNTLADNALGSGAVNGSTYGNVTGAIYLSQSGSDPRVTGYSGQSPTPYDTAFDITGNTFINNWDGVILYDNSGRYCNSVGTDVCTLIDPNWSTNNTTTCSDNQGVAADNNPDYWDLCRWKTMNVHVSDNVFSFNPATIDSLLASGSLQCTAADLCGYNGLYAFNAGGGTQPSGCSVGSDPPWSCGTSTSVKVSYDLGNSFSDNTYYGPWEFWAFNQGDADSWSTWTAALTSECSQSDYGCSNGFGQDSGSTLSTSGGPYW